MGHTVVKPPFGALFSRKKEHFLLATLDLFSLIPNLTYVENPHPTLKLVDHSSWVRCPVSGLGE